MTPPQAENNAGSTRKNHKWENNRKSHDNKKKQSNNNSTCSERAKILRQGNDITLLNNSIGMIKKIRLPQVQ